MKIGIIGAGNVGGTLGTRWAQNGHEVLFGSRNPGSEEMKKLIATAGKTSSAATNAEVTRACDVLALTTPWPVTQAVVESLGDLTGKVVVDATNPLLPDLSGVETGNTSSGAEQVARWARGAKVVKAFNTVGFNIMAEPAFGAERPVLFYCGDDGAAKNIVKGLVDELGFEAVDAGPLKQARVLEPFALLWISLAVFYGMGREFAFKLLRR